MTPSLRHATTSFSLCFSLRSLTTLAAATGLLLGVCSNLPAAELSEKAFQSPPDSARPWVYLFPLEGNITSNGITADLEAMRRAGIGGMLYMETDQGAPPGPADFGGRLWRNLFRHLCTEADRLGLQVNMNNDAGWCGSGGPWITPELSMQRIVWAETNLTGPLHFSAALPKPEATKDYYRDIAVLAYPTPRGHYAVPHLEGKSAAKIEDGLLATAVPSLPAEVVVPQAAIVDLTARLAADGRLVWDMPAGNWTILRLGHTSTGKDNHPAPIAGRGLECDKLSKKAADAAFAGLMEKVIADNRSRTGQTRTLVSTHIDSWEVGSQNWTPKFRAEFQHRRGYDPLRWLPVIRGCVVQNLELSERFLWDMRMTVNELIADNYAGRFRELARRHGIRLSIEAYGSPTDDMTYAGRADEPMGEFWSYHAYSGSDWCTEMASAAHVYGKPILGAEAFTASNAEKWQAHPATLKAMGDWAFCEGINRFVFHRYALQPWTNPNRAPGMSMGPWGLHYERSQTWWEQSRAWHEYLARCQYVLQQGLFVADLCFLAPQNSPQRFKSPVKSGLARPGYNFDGCPPEVVLTRLKVKNGRLVLPDGMSYRMLVLPRVPTMTPQLLRKVKQLVADGATVVGAPPLKSPSLGGYPKCDQEIKALAAELWGTEAAPAQPTERPYGKGRLIWGGEFKLLPPPAVESQNPLAKAKWIWHPEIKRGVTAPPGTRYFRKTVTVAEASPVASARLILTADNSFECWVNGHRVSAGEDFHRAFTTGVAAWLKPGQNVIEVAAVNTTDKPNPAGLIALLTIGYKNGQTQEVPTDATWQVATNAPSTWLTDATLPEGWASAKELGPWGMQPWGNVEPSMPGADPTPDITTVATLLAKMGVPEDFRCLNTNAAQSLRYIHKQLGKTDVYFVANKDPHPVQAVCAFRVQDRRPEFWWPETGQIEQPAMYQQQNAVVSVPVRLDSQQSVFVVFRPGNKLESTRVVALRRDGRLLVQATGTEAIEAPGNARGSTAAGLDLVRSARGTLQARAWQPGAYSLETADGKSLRFDVATLPPPSELAGPWDVSFDPKWGGPASVRFDALDDWSRRPEPGIRYYSGAAVYRKTFALNPPLSAQQRVFLDLGNVAVMAEVKLNGKDLGILWKAPFRVEVTDALKSGDNLLELKVVNLWINRQIGDEQLPEDSDRNPNGTLKQWPQWLNKGKPSPTGRYTFTSWRLWKKDDPLVESGLLGPVTLQVAQDVVISTGL